MSTNSYLVDSSYGLLQTVMDKAVPYHIMNGYRCPITIQPL